MDERITRALRGRQLGIYIDPPVQRMIDEVATARRRRPPIDWDTLANDPEVIAGFDITPEELEHLFNVWFQGRGR